MVAWFSSGHVPVTSVANHTTRRAATFRYAPVQEGSYSPRQRQFLGQEGQEGPVPAR